ncbi:MAG: glutamyl-tRNA(Gln) amidotransferase subunit D [Candidatus Altiarchaeales archaeon A3]|nr:MAG: glutamyl-tRNA(Gln) amidotransferase subunit D [Candidatus Altiarchaeales archaeon A3]
MNSNNTNAGDFVKITTKDKIFEGYLMPEYELESREFLFVKLKSGYNVGIKKDKISNMEIVEKREKQCEKGNTEKGDDFESADGKILILATGGTIASKIDYITGGVKPAFSASDLLSTVPEISKTGVKILGKQVINKFSENLTPDDWIKIASECYNYIKKGANGIVIPHGTDTMHYSSAVLSFMLKNLNVPVVFTGAQRSSDRGSSDATLNLINSIYFASLDTKKSDNKGVFVLMHEDTNDKFCAVFRGTRVRKMHTSRRDAFKGDKFAMLNFFERKFEVFEKNELNELNTKEKMNEPLPVILDTKIEKSVMLLKYFPTLTSDILEILCEKYKGIVIEGTGLGHVNESLIDTIKRAIDNGKFIAMTSQTIFGRTNLEVYATGRKLLKAGVVPCEDMFPEVAYVKLMFALGHYDKYEDIKNFMLTNIAYEINKRSEI